MTFNIEFQPLGLRLRSQSPVNALDAVRQAGIEITAVCGGEGTCGKCVIQILENGSKYPPSSTEKRFFSSEELRTGFRLACMTTLDQDVRMFIPASSVMAGQIMQTEGDDIRQFSHPAITQIEVTLDEARLHDLQSDLSRIRQAAELPDHYAELDVLRKIPGMLRKNNWQINLLTRSNKIIAVSPKKIEAPLGLAVDVGSTKIACYLINLAKGKTLTAKGTPNPQIAHGEDIMARLSFAMKSAENAEILHTTTMQAINDTASDMCRRINRDIREILDFCLVGNTAMHHFYLHLPTGSLAVSPFVPVVTDPLYPPASDLHLSANPGASVYVPPVKAGFIGSDHLAFLLASQFAKDDRIRLGIDIGTNTEIALQAKGKIVSVSTASGPAFEGAHIAFGMRAAPGAIEHVTIDKSNTAQIDVIGNQEPIGICGSGILDAVAQMRQRGILNERGRYNHDLDCIKPDTNNKPAFYLSSGEKVITLNQKDIDQILLAKGAIRAGIDILLDYLDVSTGQIEEVMIAGAFGSYMLPEHAIGIGMLPSIPLDYIKVVGNAAGTGARMMLRSIKARREAEELARQIEYLELTVYPDFPLFYANGIRA